MKKLLLILLCATTCFVLFSCKEKDGEPDMTEPNKTISVTFVNDVEKADIWILPQTEENRKTSLWGTATISKRDSGDKRTVEISSFDEGKYIVRIIDSDHAFYSADDMILGDNCTIHFKSDETKYESSIVVLDKDGKILYSKEAFQGVFGAY